MLFKPSDYYSHSGTIAHDRVTVKFVFFLFVNIFNFVNLVGRAFVVFCYLIY